MDVILTAVMLMSFLVGSLAFIALVILIVVHTGNKTLKNHKPVKQAAAPALKKISKTISTKPIITYYSDTPDIKEYPTTTAIYASRQFSASERRAEYRRREKSPSGVIDAVYNDMYREDGVSYNDLNRDWDANA